MMALSVKKWSIHALIYFSRLSCFLSVSLALCDTTMEVLLPLCHNHGGSEIGVNVTDILIGSDSLWL